MHHITSLIDVSPHHVTARESGAQDSPKFQVDPTPDALIPSPARACTPPSDEPLEYDA